MLWEIRKLENIVIKIMIICSNYPNVVMIVKKIIMIILLERTN